VAKRVKASDKRIINGQTDVNQLVPSSTSGLENTLHLCKSLDAARGQHDAMERPQRADRSDRLVKRNLGFLSLLTRWQQTTSCWVLTGTSQRRNADSSCSAKHLKKQSAHAYQYILRNHSGSMGGKRNFLTPTTKFNPSGQRPISDSSKSFRPKLQDRHARADQTLLKSLIVFATL
jgi:ribonucleoside-diphosphate reductase beta chain